MSDGRDLEIVLRSGVPIIVIETAEEDRFLKLLTRIAIDSPKADYRPLYRWTVTDGLQRLDLELEPQRHAIEPQDVLGHIRAVHKPGIYVLLDFHPFLDDPVNTRLLKDIALARASTRSVVVLVSHRVKLPEELAGFSARFALRLPDAQGLRQIIMRVATEHQQAAPGRRINIDSKALELLIKNLAGLNEIIDGMIIKVAIQDTPIIINIKNPTVLYGINGAANNGRNPIATTRALRKMALPGPPNISFIVFVQSPCFC